MVQNMLFDNYDLLMDSPNSTVKMRKLILQLAVQGKLAPQDLNDEPAGELLKRIKAEKEKLITEGKIKKQKPLPPIDPNDVPYELPNGWAWVRLGSLQEFINGYAFSSKDYIDEGVGIVRIGDMQNGQITTGGMKRLPSRYLDELDEKLRIKPGDLLIAMSGATTGKIAFNRTSETFLLNQRVGKINLFLVDYMYAYFFLSTKIKENLRVSAGSAIPNLSSKQINEMFFPLPPFDEQKRIVAKVDQLMQLCDQLDACQKKASTKYESLNDAALERLLSSKTTDEFANHWQFICNNFDLIYNDPAHVNKLRQAILQLAVQGKLAPQDLNDEPASELLKRIKAEKEKLIAEGKIKKTKPHPPITEDEIPYELPEGWEWDRLGNLTQVITKGSSPKWQGIQYVGRDEGLLFLTSKNVGNYNLILDNSSFVEWKFNEIEPRSILQNGDILMNIVGASIGRTALYDLDKIANINQAVCLIRFLNFFSFEKRYFLHFFNSPVCISYMFDKQVDMARPNLSMGNIARFLIPVPPLEEQKSIVAKVDQLMHLCDELETRLNQSKKDSEMLMQAVLYEAFS